MIKKKFLVILFFSFLSVTTCFASNGYILKIAPSSSSNTFVAPPSSVLSAGVWYKFLLDTTGVYKLDRKFLQNLGMPVGQINPKKIQVYGNGGQMLPFKNSEFRYDGLQENAVQVFGEDDGVFNKEDYILFYAQGPHTWNIEGNSFDKISHEYNIFSNESYYFIRVGANDGKRIQAKATVEAAAASQTINTFHDFSFYEKDEVNILKTGQQWFGDAFDIQNTRNYSIPFPIIHSNADFLLRVRAFTNSSIAASFGVTVGNNFLFDVGFGQPNGARNRALLTQQNFQPVGGDKLDIQLTFNNNGNPAADGYLDYIEVLGKKTLTGYGQQFSFRNLDTAVAGSLHKYLISNAEEVSTVWKVTDPLNPTFIFNQAVTSNQYEFMEMGSEILQQYIALDDNDYYTPSLVGNSNVENQNLHGLTDINYLIITNESLQSQAQRLADFHANHSGLTTKVVTLNSIYNEFSSGSKDISAIRDFIKHLYEHSSNMPLKYVCLFGDASYDYKNRVSENNNIVPTYYTYDSFDYSNSFASDDFFVMLDNDEGSLNIFEQQDVAIGRMLVSNVADAKNAVDKNLKHYKREALGKWRTGVSLISDDVDSAQDEAIQITVEELAKKIEVLRPELNIKKIYLDAYRQETTAVGSKYPEVNKAIRSEMENGSLMVNYFGHGGYNGLAQEGIVTLESINSWKSEENQQLFVTITCNFTRFDDPSLKSAGEALFDKTTGGSLILVSTTRDIFMDVGQSISDLLVDELFGADVYNASIAQHFMNAKNNTRAKQRFMIFCFGDPAMKLAVPNPNIQLLKMNGKSIDQPKDTIKSLARINFEGAVLEANGTIDNDFNGTLDVTIFDKPLSKQTFRNDGNGSILNFQSINNRIFTGKTVVENGEFQFEFVAPKDLRVGEFGAGKISLYASDATSDRIGFNSEILIGGVDEQAAADIIGPTIQLFMNDLLFVDGGNTNQSPLFIAKLQDENGINTSSASVGHELVAVIDDDQSNPIILNDFFEAELNGYKEGSINYQLAKLSPGDHTISIKAWDTHNNSSEASLNFVVINDEVLKLTNVLNYPNPFTSYTEFWFNHNKPNELLEVQIQVLSVSGKLVKTLHQTVHPTGNLSRSITWDGRDDFGNKIARGTYIYKLRVKHLGTNKTSKKIQKLVKL
jgi:hypothetical protein